MEKFIKVQKIMRFIPIVNFFSVFCFLFISFRYDGCSIGHFLKTFVKMAVGIVLVTLPEILFGSYIPFEWLKWLVLGIRMYLSLFIISYFSVKAQEEILYYEEENE